MVPPASHRIPRVRWYSGFRPVFLMFHLQDSHLLRSAFPCSSVTCSILFVCPQPLGHCYPRFGLFRGRSPLLAESHLDVSVQQVPLFSLCVQLNITVLLTAGFPHSDTHGSKPICSSPWLFAACRVLLRLSVPRHSPCALLNLTLQNYVSICICTFN